MYISKYLSDEEKQKEFDKAVERRREEDDLVNKRIQAMINEVYRKTKVKIISANRFSDVEEDINDFIYKKQDDRDKAFLLIDIKYTAGIGYSEALIIYSEVDPPKEET